ncbi:MAG: CpsB/CapC family capsule biosynthesis tyrosine phosphatase [Pseudomonadales bacterium]|jgi:protein-tyrosine phosphatase|nr:CpsB/CapC family capsule biosynthesis tyrosine phosphatase [Pseudomonadales bacterium]
MIDLHCHLLPGIDDGAPDLAATLALARHAVGAGITHAVVTPHIHPGRWDNERAGIEPLLDAVRAALTEAEIPLALAAGAEVRISAEILDWLPAGRLPFLGEHEGEPVLLLELPHGQVPPGTEKLVRWLRRQGVRPMIAHPERNRAIMRRPALLEPFLAEGCLLQLTAGAVAGRFGRSARRCAEGLLEAGVVTILASDAHNLKARPPELAEGRDAAARIVGAGAAERLVTDAPWALAGARFSGAFAEGGSLTVGRHPV